MGKPLGATTTYKPNFYYIVYDMTWSVFKVFCKKLCYGVYIYICYNVFGELTQLYDMSLKREKKMQIFRTNMIINYCLSELTNM